MTVTVLYPPIPGSDGECKHHRSFHDSCDLCEHVHEAEWSVVGRWRAMRLRSRRGDHVGRVVSKPSPMAISEFRSLGYLQEVNRRFLHPLGLALAVNVEDDDGSATLACIYDDRDDPEGWVYDYSSWPDPDAARKEAQSRARFIDSEIEKRRPAREALMGSVIQPAGGVDS